MNQRPKNRSPLDLRFYDLELCVSALTRAVPFLFIFPDGKAIPTGIL
jgi:hypothetical protein